MRTVKSDIHQLIHSLSKGERKKVTLQIKELGQKGIVHLQLLNAITKQKDYNEAALKKQFKASSYSIGKKRLYELIVKALVQLYDKDSIRNKLLSGLQEFEVFFKKELFNKAREKIYQLKIMVDKYQLFTYLPLIDEQIIRLDGAQNAFSNYDKASFSHHLVKRVERNQNILNNAFNYLLLEGEMIFLLNQESGSPEVWTRMDEMMKSPLLQDIRMAQSEIAQCRFCNIQLLYCMAKNDPQKALYYTLKGLSIYETFFYNLKPPEKYIIHLINAINVATGIKDQDLVTSLFEKVDAHIHLVKKRVTFCKLKMIGLKTSWYADIGNLKEGKLIIEENEKWLAEIQLTRDLSWLCFIFSSIYFLDKDYLKALNTLKSVLETKKSQKRSNIKHIGQLFQLFIYYERKEYILLESLVRSLYRKFHPQKKSYAVELTLIQMLKKLINSNETGRTSILIQSKEILLKLKEENQNNTPTILRSFDYILWIESKLQKRDLTDLLRESLRNTIIKKPSF